MKEEIIEEILHDIYDDIDSLSQSLTQACSLDQQSIQSLHHECTQLKEQVNLIASSSQLSHIFYLQL